MSNINNVPWLKSINTFHKNMFICPYILRTLSVQMFFGHILYFQIQYIPNFSKWLKKCFTREWLTVQSMQSMDHKMSFSRCSLIHSLTFTDYSPMKNKLPSPAVDQTDAVCTVPHLTYPPQPGQHKSNKQYFEKVLSDRCVWSTIPVSINCLCLYYSSSD